MPQTRGSCECTCAIRPASSATRPRETRTAASDRGRPCGLVGVALLLAGSQRERPPDASNRRLPRQLEVHVRRAVDGGPQPRPRRVLGSSHGCSWVVLLSAARTSWWSWVGDFPCGPLSVSAPTSQNFTVGVFGGGVTHVDRCAVLFVGDNLTRTRSNLAIPANFGRR